MSRLIVLGLSVAVALGSAFPSRALYSCLRTGQQNQSRCCCTSEDSSPSSCSDCRKDSCEIPPAANEGSLNEGASIASLVSRCCLVTYQKVAQQSLVPGGAAKELKKSLDGARLFPALVVPFLELPSRPGRDPALERTASGGPAVSPPLYLLHCIFLI